MRISIGHDRNAYDVIIASGLLGSIGRLLLTKIKPQTRLLLVSDTHVAPLYAKQAEETLIQAGFSVQQFTFQAGEPSKTSETLMCIYDALAENEFTRSDAIVTLGGGVVCDMGGFAAATYMRGIRYFQIPTSLLAQVDASVGGKTAIDRPQGKNLVGAFWRPAAVFIDPETLSTLPERYVHDGMGEVIKYGCIDDRDLLKELNTKDVLADPERMIARCIESKKRFVETDYKDEGQRMILNFGHTFGHAIEKLHGFSEISHGEAVGIGMVLASEIGERCGVALEGGITAEIKQLLKKYRLPTSTTFSSRELVSAALQDKKGSGDWISLILLKRLGTPTIHRVLKTDLYEMLPEGQL